MDTDTRDGPEGQLIMWTPACAPKDMLQSARCLRQANSCHCRNGTEDPGHWHIASLTSMRTDSVLQGATCTK